MRLFNFLIISNVIIVNSIITFADAQNLPVSFAESVLVTGANRGQGLEWVKQLSALPEPPTYIFATCRTLDNRRYIEKLQEVADASTISKIIIAKLDVTNETDISNIASLIRQHTGDQGLNVIINNAGYFDRATASLYTATMDSLVETFKVNAAGPLLITQKLASLLKTASTQYGIREGAGSRMTISRAGIINIGSVMGSIEQSTGGYYSYRMSKAALNMVTKSMAEDLRPNAILVIAFHPGWVRTRMGGINAKITTTEAIQSMIRTSSVFDETNTGGYYNRNGVRIAY